MYSPPLEGNFCDDHGKAMKPAIIRDCNRHMGYVDKSDRMTNYYCVSRWTRKRTKKLFFQLMDLTIFNSCIILASCVSKLLHWQFRQTLVRNLIQKAGRVPQPQTARWKRQVPSTSQIQRLDSRHNRHWLMQCKRIRCHLYSARNKETRTYKCRECNIRLCATPCFKVLSHQNAFLRTSMEKRNTQL